MKNGATYFKYSVILIGIILVFLLFRRCGNGGEGKATNDTVSVRVDTVYAETKKDTHYIPVPYKVEVPKPYKVEVHDTLEYPEYIELRDATKDEYISDYLSTKYYLDTLSNEYGSAIVADTLRKNSIVGRGIKSSFSVPTITTTVTVKQPKRVVAYLGFDVLGTKESFINNVGANFGIQAKNGKQYEVKAFLNKDGNPSYGVGFKLPIRLSKQ